MTDKQKHHLEAAAVVAGLLLLLWWLLHSAATPAPASDTTDPTGQSTQANNFIPASFDVPPFSINVQNIQYPISAGGAGNFPLYLDVPLTTYNLVVGADDCDCGTGNNCPVSPYTIASLSKMQALGVSYANAIIQAANDTQAAILQNFANAGENVYYVQQGPAIP